MGKRRIDPKKLFGRLFQADRNNRFSAHPHTTFEQLEDRLLLTTVPTQAAIAGFANNWYISNTGQTIAAQVGTPGADINLENAWDITTGSKNVIVADLEDGVSFNNNELLPNLYDNAKENPNQGAPIGDNDLDGFANDFEGWNFANGTNDPSTDLGGPNGTAAAGLIGAAGDAADPIIGVDMNVSIMPFNIPLVEGPAGTMVYDTNSLIAGLNYITMRKNVYHDNIAVVVMNLYQLDAAIAFNDLPLINALQRVTNAGIVIVSAAGDTATGGVNDDAVQTILSEANDSRIIQVAATDNQDNLWAESNYGPDTVQLAAPGVNIPVMGEDAATGALGIADASTTAISADLVAGVLALEKAAAPGAGPDQLISALLRGVDPVLGLTGLVKTGGRLDALKAVQDIIGDVAPIGGTTLFTNSMITGFAEDFDSTPNPIQVELVVNGTVVATQTANGPVNGGYGFTFSNVAALEQPGLLTTSIVAIDPLSGKGTTIKTEVLNIQNEHFVTHLYEDMLGREPDTGGLDFWATAVAVGTPTIQIADAIAHSAEYNTDIVDQLYLTFLNEAPDPVQGPMYISELEAGSTTVESIENALLSSTQFFDNSGGTNQTWIAQLYETLLGRAGSAGDINGWVNALITHTPQQVVNGFLFSTEYRTDLENTYYKQYLHRTGSPSDVAGWVNTGLDQLKLQENIFGSLEYYLRSTNSLLYVSLGLTPPSQTLTAGTASAPITVTLLGRGGNAVVATAPQVINLTTTSGSGEFTDINNVPITSVTVAAGQSTATFLYKDTLTGTPTITATPVGAFSVTPAAQLETVLGAAPAQFAFTTASQTLTTDVPSGIITFELLDIYGNVTTARAGGLVVNLETTSGQGSFTDTLNNAITSVTVAAGASTGSFKYLDGTVGTPTIQISAAGLTPDTQIETVNPSVPTQVAFLTAPQNIATDAASHTITVELLDALNHPTIAPAGGVVVNLATTSAGGSFLNLSSATITSVTIAAGTGTASFKYFDTIAGTPTLTASAAGLTPAMQGATVTAPVATALAIITNPQTLTAGVTSGTITVQLQDQSGDPFNAAAGGVTVNLSSTSGSGEFLSGVTPITSVTIGAGTNTASFTYNDTLSGAPTLTVAATGLGSGTQQETVNPAAALEIAIITAAQTNLTIGIASAPITVELKDQFGNIAKAGVFGQTITLMSNSPGGSFTPTSITVAAGATTASFTYTDTDVGSPTITASTMFGFVLATATQMETVFPLAATQLMFTTAPQTLTAGVTSSTITVELLDQNNDPTTARTGGQTINLATTSLGGVFTSGATPITSITIPLGSGTASFTYTDTVANTVANPTTTITASATGLTSATQVETVNPAAAAMLVFTTVPQSLNPSILSATMTVTLEDQFGNVVNAGAGITVNLSSSSLGGSFTDTGGNPVTSVTMATGTSTASFKYMDSVVGSPTVTAAATGLTSATQIETIVPFAATKLVFITPLDANVNDPNPPPAGTLIPTLSPPNTVQLQDADGNPVNAPAGGIVVHLSSTNTGEFTDGNGNVTTGPFITTVTIVAGTSTASFLYTNTNRLNDTVTASATGLTSATQTLDMSAVGISQELKITSNPQTLTSGVASTTITIQLVDENGAPILAAAGGEVINLSSTSSTGVFLNGVTPITTVTIAAGSSTATFTYEDTEPTGDKIIISAGVTGNILVVVGSQGETMM